MNWLQKIAGYYGVDNYRGYWIDPNGEILETEHTHDSWIGQNEELLLAEYDLDLRSWSEEYVENSRQESYQNMYDEKIRDIAFKQDIDNSQVILTDKQQEELYDYAEGDEPGGVQMVDYLIQNGWIRFSHKNAYIQVEGNEAIPGFWDKAEMTLIQKVPKVWSNSNYKITVNDKEVYSGDLQQAGSLRSAIESDRIRVLRR